MGGVLLGFVICLKEKYYIYSVVFVSGVMVIFYFMIYISYSFYEFMLDILVFGFMVVVIGMIVVVVVYYKE